MPRIPCLSRPIFAATPTNESPLLSTLLFARPDVLAELREELEADESAWMKPSGTPPYIELYKKVDRQQQSIDELPSRLEEIMEVVLEKTGVAAGNITKDLLRDEIRALLDEVGLRCGNSNKPADAPPETACHYHAWGGKFHVLPREFQFPSIDPLGAWHLWWFGNQQQKYPPYKGISSGDLDTPQKKAALSEWSIMMRHIINGIEAKINAPMPAIIEESHVIQLFNIGYETLRLKPSKRKRRADQLKLTTVLRLVRQGEYDQRSESRTSSRSRKRQNVSRSDSGNNNIVTSA